MYRASISCLFSKLAKSLLLGRFWVLILLSRGTNKFEQDEDDLWLENYNVC
jgi:hypothetical protein